MRFANHVRYERLRWDQVELRVKVAGFINVDLKFDRRCGLRSETACMSRKNGNRITRLAETCYHTPGKTIRWLRSQKMLGFDRATSFNSLNKTFDSFKSRPEVCAENPRTFRYHLLQPKNPPR
jgi:hypothetical protein